MNISIIIICYNQEKYIQETLNGIVHQTVKPYEVIIADDGSSDSTPDIIKKYIQENNLDNWKLLLNFENKGITKNLRSAIEAASGEIIMLNAGDDISLPNRVELTIEAFKKYPYVSIVTGNLDIINSYGEIIGEIINSNKDSNDIGKTINNGMPFVHPVGQSIKKDLFDKFGPLPVDVPNEDDQISFRGIIEGGILCLPVKLMKYRIHQTSASAWIRNKQKLRFFYDRYLKDMPVRKRHMQLWLESINRTSYSQNTLYINSLNKRILIYDFFSKLDNSSFMSRLIFTLKNIRYLSNREKLYSFLGKYGIYAWQYARNVLKH